MSAFLAHNSLLLQTPALDLVSVSVSLAHMVVYGRHQTDVNGVWRGGGRSSSGHVLA
jgi:hypothetical protein